MNIKKKYITIAAALTSLIVITYMVGGETLRNDAQASPKTGELSSDTSVFEFTGAEGWRKGPSNTTSMALFSSAKPDGTSDCFTSIEYKDGKVNAAAELQKQQNDLSVSGASMSPGTTIKATIQTNTDKKQYELQQYTVSGGSSQLMGGLQLGYLQMPDGYLEIEGHCNTAEQLPTTVPALQAYKFVKD